MKKINDQELIRMNKEGMTNTAIAEVFGVSKQAIGQRLTYLKSFDLPESLEKLTDKRKAFALAKAEGKTDTDAAMVAFDCKDRTVARSLGHNTMQDPDVNEAIQDLLHQEGIGRRVRAQHLKRLITAPTDLNAVARGLDMANKMVGDYTPEKVQVDIDIRSLNLDMKIDALQREREALEAEIISEESGTATQE